MDSGDYDLIIVMREPQLDIHLTSESLDGDRDDLRRRINDELLSSKKADIILEPWWLRQTITFLRGDRLPVGYSYTGKRGSRSVVYKSHAIELLTQLSRHFIMIHS